MSINTFDIQTLYKPDDLAVKVAELFDKFKVKRETWEDEVTDVRNAIFASTIDTSTNQDNPFLNRTTIPKLAQIYDNVLANYDASLFSNADWFTFETTSKDATMAETKKKILAYMKTKTRQLKFRSFMRDVLADWILYGNCFVGIEYVHERFEDPSSGNKYDGYIGAKPYRISPYDIVFNIESTSFKDSPKIIRTKKSIGQIAKEIDTKPELGYTPELLNELLERRYQLARGGYGAVYDDRKNQTLIADGFDSLQDYGQSGVVEILEFYGDLFIEETGILYPNHHIVVFDRCRVIKNEPVNTWNGEHHIYTCAWRNRPDNLLGMSPFANLIGMQHRVDKAENTKADVFDQIAYPVVIEKGDVTYYDGNGEQNGIRGTPGGLYRTDNDGDVGYLRPDTTALNADNQINYYLGLMEELAGAPKNTMGIRTPGEKTAFEVNSLDNAAARVFQNKTTYFEETFLEPVLNGMLEIARRNLDVVDTIKSTDKNTGVENFVNITREDLMASVQIYAIGSRYFTRNALLAQNLNQLSNSPIFQLIQPHLSRIQLAKVVETILGLEEFGLVREDVGIEEDMEVQRLVQTGKDQLQAESMTPTDMPQGMPQ